MIGLNCMNTKTLTLLNVSRIYLLPRQIIIGFRRLAHVYSGELDTCTASVKQQV